MRGRMATWKEIATGTSIGPSRLIRLATPLTTSRLRLRITKAPVSPALSELGVYLEPRTRFESDGKERCVTSEAAVLIRRGEAATADKLDYLNKKRYHPGSHLDSLKERCGASTLTFAAVASVLEGA